MHIELIQVYQKDYKLEQKIVILWSGVKDMCFDFSSLKDGHDQKRLSFTGPMSWSKLESVADHFAGVGHGFVLKAILDGTETGFLGIDVERLSHFRSFESQVLLYNVQNLRIQVVKRPNSDQFNTKCARLRQETFEEYYSYPTLDPADITCPAVSKESEEKFTFKSAMGYNPAAHIGYDHNNMIDHNNMVEFKDKDFEQYQVIDYKNRKEYRLYVIISEIFAILIFICIAIAICGFLFGLFMVYGYTKTKNTLLPY